MKKLTFLGLFILSFPLFSAEIPFTVFHTNDLHSHLDGVKVPSGETYERRGGFARLTSVISELREKKKDEIVIGVDAGDFFSGTIFSAVGVSSLKDFPEYQFFMENKYDLLTFGNHEFDPLNDGLEIMLKKMLHTPGKTPLVASNLYVNHDSPLRKYLENPDLVKPYLVKEFQSPKGSLRVGFLGILGPDGCLVSRSTRGDVHFIGFDDEQSKQKLGALADHLNKLIIELKRDKKVDLVILSMHGGGKESHELASKLKGLDVFVSGHTHKQEFAIVNGVPVNQTGSYGENLGLMEFTFDTKLKKVKMTNPTGNHIITITEKIAENKEWKKRIDQWRKKSFELMGQTTDPSEIIFTPKKSYIRSSAIPNPMGELVTHAILTELNDTIKDDKIDAYFTSMGLVRTSFHKNTPYSRAEIFEATSIGFDKNKTPGVDVVSFYLSPKDVKLVINFMEIYTYISTSFSPAISPNLSFKIRKWGIPFLNRIYDIKLNGKDLADYDRPIKIATNKFVVMNIETVKKITRGFVDLVPKTKTGEPVKDYVVHPKEYLLMIEHFKKHPGYY